MKKNDFAEFSEALLGVTEYYRRDKPTAFTVQIWWESLKEFDLPAVQKAFVAHINRADKDGQFMPTVSGIRQLLQGTTGDAAVLAWTKVTEAVKRVGTGQSVAFDDPLIHRVVSDMGGWVQLGKKSEDEWPFVGREFEQRYRGYAQKGDRPPYPPRLIGYYEAHNGQQGFESDPAVLIGDPARAKAVMLGGNDGPLLLTTIDRSGSNLLPELAEMGGA